MSNHDKTDKPFLEAKAEMLESLKGDFTGFFAKYDIEVSESRNTESPSCGKAYKFYILLLRFNIMIQKAASGEWRVAPE